MPARYYGETMDTQKDEKLIPSPQRTTKKQLDLIAKEN
jgi:hypothetical protein